MPKKEKLLYRAGIMDLYEIAQKQRKVVLFKVDQKQRNKIVKHCIAIGGGVCGAASLAVYPIAGEADDPSYIIMNMGSGGTAVRDYWRVVQASKKDLLLYLDQPIKIKDESPISSSILSDILKDTVKVMEP